LYWKRCPTPRGSSLTEGLSYCYFFLRFFFSSELRLIVENYGMWVLPFCMSLSVPHSLWWDKRFITGKEVSHTVKRVGLEKGNLPHFLGSNSSEIRNKASTGTRCFRGVNYFRYRTGESKSAFASISTSGGGSRSLNGSAIATLNMLGTPPLMDLGRARWYAETGASLNRHRTKLRRRPYARDYVGFVPSLRPGFGAFPSR